MKIRVCCRRRRLVLGIEIIVAGDKMWVLKKGFKDESVLDVFDTRRRIFRSVVVLIVETSQA